MQTDTPKHTYRTQPESGNFPLTILRKPFKGSVLQIFNFLDEEEVKRLKDHLNKAYPTN